MARKLIRGKVAGVLNDMAVALNVGRGQGLREGMVFDVLAEGATYDVKDPDTGEVLGSVGRPKARVRVVYVDERMAVARTHDTDLVNIGGMGGLRSELDGLFQPEEWVEKPRKLKGRQMAWNEMPQGGAEISAGDVVEEVSKEMADIDLDHSVYVLPTTRHEAS